MSDVNLITPQLVSGAAILLSFFAGYKYALRVMRSVESPVRSAAGTLKQLFVTIEKGFCFYCKICL